MTTGFSFARLWTIIHKEFILMKRDPGVIVIMAILPLILVCLAGYAVNLNPKNVPTVLMNYDNSSITSEFIQSMKNSGYFSIIDSTHQAQKANDLLRSGKALLILTIPAGFTQKLIHQNNPEILVEDGGTDHLSTARAISALTGLQRHFIANLSSGALNYLQPNPYPFQIIWHRLFDPDRVTQYNVIPGMIGMILMLTMLMITTIIAFRDIQEGTIESLLVSPTKPFEILLAEILSYIIIGYVQIILGLLLSYYLFHVPFVGKVSVLLIATLPYIIAELSLGLTVATFCSTQFQAVQVNTLFIACSIILTGFIFPIFGMPQWAQILSQFIPLTHFLQILRGIMLKGNGFPEIWQNLWPLILYSSIMILIAVNRFQRHFK